MISFHGAFVLLFIKWAACGNSGMEDISPQNLLHSHLSVQEQSQGWMRYVRRIRAHLLILFM